MADGYSIAAMRSAAAAARRSAVARVAESGMRRAVCGLQGV